MYLTFPEIFIAFCITKLPSRISTLPLKIVLVEKIVILSIVLQHSVIFHFLYSKVHILSLTLMSSTKLISNPINFPIQTHPSECSKIILII